MKERNIKIVNDRSESHKITESKTLMEFVIEYTKEKKLRNEVFDQINHIRLDKKIILQAELVGAWGLATTEYYNRIKVESMIEWKNFPPTPKSSSRIE